MAPANNFTDPNIYKAERELQATQNHHGALAIRCPHCQHLGQFAAVGAQGVHYHKSVQHPSGAPMVAAVSGSIRVCPNNSCKGLVFAIATNGEIIEINPPQTLDFSLKNLPSSCQEILVEAIACYSAKAYRASAMMVRRLLEEICELNDAKGKDLHAKLEALKQNVILPPILFEAMGELKSLGNDAAHIEARAYDNIGKEEAADSIELAKEILKAIYQLKGLVGRLQSRKAQPA